MINLIKLVVSVFLFGTFPIGVALNSLLLWTLVFKMKKTVNTFWFFSLVSAAWIYSMIMPFLGVLALLDSHWPFGLALCKFVYMLISFCLYTSVFSLTVMSLDRYILVVHPVRARCFRTPRLAAIISAVIWISAGILSLPTLVVRDVQPDGNNKTICYNNYVLSDDWKDPRVQSRRQQINLCFFLIRLLLGFLIPFVVITACYISIAIKVKMRSLSRSSKYIKVVMVSILSFFVCWLPYHVYQGLDMYKGSVSRSLIQAFILSTAISTSMNACLSPIFYLFLGENFRAIFKKSLYALIESAFQEEMH